MNHPTEPTINDPPAIKLTADGGRRSRTQALLLVLLTTLSLVPFIHKALFADDTLFLYCAEQVLVDPGNPLGREVNWYGTRQPLSEVTKNPPLQCYTLALVGGIFGFGETALHTAMIPWALLWMLSAWGLARRMTPQPQWAVAFAWVTPPAIVCSTAVMCDMPMTALYTLAMLLTVQAGKSGRARRALAAGAVAGLAALTKYFAWSLMPLAIVYFLFCEKRRRLIAWFVLPMVLIGGGYELACRHLYQQSLLLNAFFYAQERHAAAGANWPWLIQGLTYVGGLCLPLVFLLPFAEAKGRRWIWMVGMGLTALLAAAGEAYRPLLPPEILSTRFTIHLAVFCAAGVYFAAVVIRELWARWEAETLLLVLWIAGTFLFAARLNWTMSARNFLPLIVPLAIVMTRRIGHRQQGAMPRAVWLAFLPGWLLALGAAAGDAGLADNQRTAAHQIMVAAEERGQERVWFLGHWGFQRYLEAAGAEALDNQHREDRSGDWIARPFNNTNVTSVKLDEQDFPTIQRWTSPVAAPCSVMSLERGAGFYSTLWGPLPYVFGKAPDERYEIRVRAVKEAR